MNRTPTSCLVHKDRPALPGCRVCEECAKHMAALRVAYEEPDYVERGLERLGEWLEREEAPSR